MSRVFDAPEDLTVTLTVRDGSGSACDVGTDTARILVNAAPVVDAGPDRELRVGAAHDVLRFDASSATDADDHGLSFEWDFGDGVQSTGAIVRHRFSAAGTFTVTARATDTTGLACGVSTDTATVTALPRDIGLASR